MPLPPPPPPLFLSALRGGREEEFSPSDSSYPLEWNKGLILCALGTQVKTLNEKTIMYTIYRIGAKKVYWWICWAATTGPK